MIEVIFENLINIFAAALIALMGILGSIITAKLSENTRLASVKKHSAAELQQTVGEKLKAASADGKLSDSEVKALGAALIEKTMEKMSRPAVKLLDSAGVDIIALIHGSAEAFIAKQL